MCLKATSKIKTSKRDKTVYKVFNTYRGKLVSPFQCVKYKYGEQRTIKSFGIHKYVGYNSYKGVSRRVVNTYVYKGLHAFTTVKQAKKYCTHWNTKCVVPCIIPAGTEYILGDDKDIVSLSLIIGKKQCV